MTRTSQEDAIITAAAESAPREIIVAVSEDELHEELRKTIIERILCASLTPGKRSPRSADERRRTLRARLGRSSGVAQMKRARDGKSPVRGRRWRHRDDTLAVETRISSAVADHAPPFEAVVRSDRDAAAKAARELLDADRDSMGR